MLNALEGVAKNIAGDITLSDNSFNVMRKWREIFGVSQSHLAKSMNVSPSVVSDYESGRRLSPGTSFVKRYVETLVRLDYENGGRIISKFGLGQRPDAILDLKELSQPVKASRFVKLVEGKVIVNRGLVNKRELRGYTVIDSIKAILNLSENEFRSIYGSSTERALVFTKVKMGRSPMIAVKVTQPKPGMIILHGVAPGKVDKLAVHIAEKENMPLIVSRLATEDELVEKLRGGLK